MDGAWLTLIFIPNSLRLPVPLTVVPTSHLYLRGQRKSFTGLTPHPSTFGLVNISHTHPNIHSFLQLPRGLVYIYSRPKSSYDRVTWGSGGYLHTASPLRLHVFRDGAVYDRLYQPSRRHSRTYILTHFLQKTDLSKIFWALSEGPRGSTPASPDSSPRAPYPEIFSRLSTSKLTKGFTHALPTSNVTPTSTPYSDSPPRVT